MPSGATAKHGSRATGSPRNATREKILRAAERLFAREGEARVTLRQIARAAGQGNVAAVQYHFGGKEALLAEIVERHQREIDAARRTRLDADLAKGRGGDLHALLQVLVAPLAAKLDSPSGRAYLQIQAWRQTPDALHPATRKLARRIARALGTAAADPVRDRLVALLLFHALADRARQEEARGRAAVSRERFVRTLTTALHGLYTGAIDR